MSRYKTQSVWDAHKVRNQIAHGDGDISRTQAQEAIANFRRVLNVMGEM